MFKEKSQNFILFIYNIFLWWLYNHHNDYYFYLGDNIIQVYYLKDCTLDDDDLFFNMKIIYILKEIVEKDAYVFWLDDEEELDNVIEYIDYLNEFVIIVIEK